MDIKGLITVKDAARQIDRTDKRVYQLIEEGKLETVQLGREYLVKTVSVSAYLRNRNGSIKRRSNGAAKPKPRSKRR